MLLCSWMSYKRLFLRVRFRYVIRWQTDFTWTLCRGDFAHCGAHGRGGRGSVDRRSFHWPAQVDLPAHIHALEFFVALWLESNSKHRVSGHVSIFLGRSWPRRRKGRRQRRRKGSRNWRRRRPERGRCCSNPWQSDFCLFWVTCDSKACLTKGHHPIARKPYKTMWLPPKKHGDPNLLCFR